MTKKHEYLIQKATELNNLAGQLENATIDLLDLNRFIPIQGVKAIKLEIAGYIKKHPELCFDERLWDYLNLNQRVSDDFPTSLRKAASLILAEAAKMEKPTEDKEQETRPSQIKPLSDLTPTQNKVLSAFMEAIKILGIKPHKTGVVKAAHSWLAKKYPQEYGSKGMTYNSFRGHLRKARQEQEQTNKGELGFDDLARMNHAFDKK